MSTNLNSCSTPSAKKMFVEILETHRISQTPAILFWAIDMRKNGRLRRHDIRFLETCAGQDLEKKKKQRHSVVSVGNDDVNKRHTKCPVIIEETCKKEQEEVTSERDWQKNSSVTCTEFNFLVVFFLTQEGTINSFSKKVPHKGNMKWSQLAMRWHTHPFFLDHSSWLAAFLRHFQGCNFRGVVNSQPSPGSTVPWRVSRSPFERSGVESISVLHQKPPKTVKCWAVFFSSLSVLQLGLCIPTNGFSPPFQRGWWSQKTELREFKPHKKGSPTWQFCEVWCPFWGWWLHVTLPKVANVTFKGSSSVTAAE